MPQVSDLIGWGISLIIAIIGVSSIVVRTKRHKNNQTIKNGDGNIQVGGNAKIRIDKKEEQKDV